MNRGQTPFMHYNVLLAGSVPWLAFHFFCYSNKLRQRLGVWASRPHFAFVVIFTIGILLDGAQGAGGTPTPPAVAARY